MFYKIVFNNIARLVLNDMMVEMGSPAGGSRLEILQFRKPSIDEALILLIARSNLLMMSRFLVHHDEDGKSEPCKSRVDYQHSRPKPSCERYDQHDFSN